MTAGDLPAATELDCLSLSVGDRDRMTAFYRETIGLAVLNRDETRTVLGAGGDSFLELRAAPEDPPRPAPTAGLFHVAIRVPSRRALGDALRRIREQWELDGASDHHVSEALYLTDPEGNDVEIYRDRNPKQWPTRDDGRVSMDTLPLNLDGVAAVANGEDDAPPDTILGHVHLECTSVPASKSFYVDVLGLGVRQELDGAQFLAAGDYHHHIGLNEWQNRTDRATGRGLAWYRLIVPDHETVDAARERFRNAEIPTENIDNGLSVTDPDGIQLRLQTRSS